VVVKGTQGSPGMEFLQAGKCRFAMEEGLLSCEMAAAAS